MSVASGETLIGKVTDAALAPGARKHPRVRRLVSALGLVSILLTGAPGCSLFGEFVEQQHTTPEENLRYQRLTAQQNRIKRPNVEILTFTQEGNVSGAGQWAANAMVTIGGREYREIIGPDFMVGEDLPTPAPSLVPGPLTVNYSDGTSEVLR